MRKHVKGNVSWIGYLDWELETFHGDEYSIGNGSSQNAYLIEEEKTVLMDTVWMPHREWFIENLKSETDINKIDFIIMQHGEQDHSGALPDLMKEIPNTPIYCTEEGVKSLEGQYGKNGWDLRVVHTGDTLDIGNGKQLIFMEMKMLHWPDSMATYMTGDNILFSMDAFGQHFAVEELFNDLADQGVLYREAMKYFANILNPFAMFVNPKLEEIAALNLPIDIICPSHGVIWRDDPMQIVETYAKWADAYQEDQVTIVYDTMWDGTKKLAHEIGDEINRQSPSTKVKIYNASKYDKNDIMTEVFRSKAIAVGSPTCANDVLSSVAGWLTFLKSLKFKNKKAAAFGCYGWSGESVGIIEKELKEAGFDLVEEKIRCNWNPGDADYAGIPALVKQLLGGESSGVGATSVGAESSAAGTADGTDNPVAGSGAAAGESSDVTAEKTDAATGESSGTTSGAEGSAAPGESSGTEESAAPGESSGTEESAAPGESSDATSGAEGSTAPGESSGTEESTAPGESRTFVCSVCGWVYDEKAGCPSKGIAPGTRWEDVPQDFVCPVCKMPKDKFEQKGGPEPIASAVETPTTSDIAEAAASPTEPAASAAETPATSAIAEAAASPTEPVTSAAETPAAAEAQITVEAPAAEDVTEVTGNPAGSRVFKCTICGWTYSEAEGSPENGIRPGTLWEDVPEDFRCPVCHVPKSKFTE